MKPMKKALFERYDAGKGYWSSQTWFITAYGMDNYLGYLRDWTEEYLAAHPDRVTIWQD